MPYLNKRNSAALKIATGGPFVLALLVVATGIVMVPASPFWLSAEATTDEVNEESTSSVRTIVPNSTDLSKTADNTIISNTTDSDNVIGEIPSSTDFDNLSNIILNATDGVSSSSIPSIAQSGEEGQEVLDTNNLEDLAEYG